MVSEKTRIRWLIDRLIDHYQNRIEHWWRFDHHLELIVGSILTQNTTWTSVEKGISSLKNQQLLDITQLADPQNTKQIEICIRPTGYFRQKTRFLQEFCKSIRDHFGTKLEEFLNQSCTTLREQLLAYRGIGPETADTILLYTAEYPKFIVDAYTTRILGRFGVSTDLKYKSVQALFENSIPPEIVLYQQAHAAFDEHGKTYCLKTKPLCDQCPVKNKCNFVSQT